jgi:hypothetical protein
VALDTQDLHLLLLLLVQLLLLILLLLCRYSTRSFSQST